jgi:hypothetical protein
MLMFEVTVDKEPAESIKSTRVPALMNEQHVTSLPKAAGTN